MVTLHSHHHHHHHNHHHVTYRFTRRRCARAPHLSASRCLNAAVDAHVMATSTRPPSALGGCVVRACGPASQPASSGLLSQRQAGDRWTTELLGSATVQRSRPDYRLSGCTRIAAVHSNDSPRMGSPFSHSSAPQIQL